MHKKNHPRGSDVSRRSNKIYKYDICSRFSNDQLKMNEESRRLMIQMESLLTDF